MNDRQDGADASFKGVPVRIEANYAKNQQKPVKKSCMMARLEAMQKELEEQQKLQQQQSRKK